MKKRLIYLLIILMMAMGACVAAEVAPTLTLPSALEMIDDESFRGCIAIEEVVVPEGVHYLGERAFADCLSLNRVKSSWSVKEIAEDCFERCGEALLMECEPGSAAHAYALANGLDYDADTLCRAMIVGQSYKGTGLALKGPPNDAQAMQFMLENQFERPFLTFEQSDLTAQEILEHAESIFSEATEKDISLFYYSGHGTSNGELLGVDSATVSPAALRGVLDKVPGRKIVIIDACYSGQWVMAASRGAEPRGFNEAFLAGFLGRTRSLAGGEYYIISSARDDEECMEMSITSGSHKKVMGCFTYAFCRGCGWDGVASRSMDKAADRNGDGAVSIGEAFEYAAVHALMLSPGQHAQIKADNGWAFAPFR